MTKRPRGRPRKEGALRILLQVRLNDAHMDFLKRVAREQRLTPAEAVRHVLHLEMGSSRSKAGPPLAPEPPLAATAPAHPAVKAEDALSAFTRSDSGVYRAGFDGWQLSVSQKGGSRMWGWYAHRGNEFSKDDPSGKARSLQAAAKSVIKAVRERTPKVG